ncbi:MAG: hypothetical protein AAFY75_03560 [Pseudomonadota bacterium]
MQISAPPQTPRTLAANLGRFGEACAVLAPDRTLEPERTLKAWQSTGKCANWQGGKQCFAGLRRAGLPQE